MPNFGYPFCHQGDTLDPEYGKNRSCAEFDKPPALKLGTHIAPLGMKFYNGKMFPAEYQGNIFIAMHGSWNRTVKQGYNVMRVKSGREGQGGQAEPFLTGFLQDDKADPPMWGRPVDLLVMKDGSMLVSDDYNGIIYRVSYGRSDSLGNQKRGGDSAAAFLFVPPAALRRRHRGWARRRR